MRKKLDIRPGDSFGVYTVIEELPKVGHGRTFLVQCVCGLRRDMRQAAFRDCARTCRHPIKDSELDTIIDTHAIRANLIDQIECACTILDIPVPPSTNKRDVRQLIKKLRHLDQQIESRSMQTSEGVRPLPLL